MKNKASVIIPVYNEEVTIVNNIPILVEFLKKRLTDFELIIVENGSRDKTREEADILAQKFEFVKTIHLSKPCLGEALKRGFLSSSFKKLVYFPVDLSTDMCFITDSLALLEENDIVLGSKRVSPNIDGRGILRRVCSRIYHGLVSKFLGICLTDTTCVKAFRREIINSLIYSTPSLSHIYETELIVEAVRRGYRIVEVPVRVFDTRSSRESLMFKAYSKLKDLFSLYVDMMSISSGIFLCFFGVTGLILVSVDKLFNKIHFQSDQTIIMFSIIVTILGIQSIFLGLLANLFLQIRGEIHTKE